MINNWKISKLGEIADIKRGLPSQDLNYVDSIEEGVRLIRINDFKSDNPRYIKETEKTQKLTIQKGDVIIAGTGATAGISFLVKELWDGLPFSYNAPRIRVKEGNDSMYIYYILNSDKIKRQQNKLFTGNAQPFLDTRAIASFKIPVPPLPEQQKIAEILSTVDAKIEVIDQQITETQELKKGLMQRLLTKGIGHTEFKDSPLGKIPKSWEVVELQSLLNANKNITYGIVQPGEYVEDGVHLIRSQDYTKGWWNPIETIMKVSLEVDKPYERSRVQVGDILITVVGANVGRIAVVPNKLHGANISRSVARISINNDMANSLFMRYYLASNGIKTLIRLNQVGGAQPVLNLKELAKIKVPVPQYYEQDKIADIIISVDRKLDVLAEKKRNYQALKQGLMQQLLTGKVRVKVTAGV